MRSLTRLVHLGLIAVLLVFLATPLATARIWEWQDASQESQDLLLLGFGELSVQYLDVSGNVEAFEASNPNYKEDFSTNYRMSLFANGSAVRGFSINGAAIVDSRIGDEYRTVDPSIFRLKMSVKSTEPLWDGWRFTGHGLYDPARQWELANLDTRLLTQPQEPSRLELLVRLESDEHGLIEGGSLRPSFKDAAFTLHQRSLFGVHADLYTDRLGVEAVAGKLEGKSFREGSVMGIRADGTSGPFDLSHAPITRGSEEVKIEVRDRFNESTVLSSRTLVRDLDYNIDYLQGRVLLHQPVASETISSDPVYIVITFDYLREADDDLFGGRAMVQPIDELQVSGSYLHRNIDNTATGTGVEEPEDLVAADAFFKMDDHTTGYFEIAGTQNPDIDDDFTAVRVGAETKVVEDLTLNAGFQRIDDQFRSFTNSDLDPNKNQQRFNLGGKYDLTERQTVKASFASIRGLEANGQYNAYDGLRTEDIYSASYHNNLMDQLGFGVRLERRNIEDRENANHEDTYQNRAVIDLGGRFEDVSVVGDFGYKANYELIMFRNNIQIGEHDTNTNQLALSVTSKPTERIGIELGQRVSLKNDREDDLWSERQDASFAKVQVQLRDDVNTYTTAEYKRYTVPGSSVQLWQDDPYKTQWAGTFAVEYLPVEKIKSLLKLGRQQTREWYVDSALRSTTDYLLGQVTYFHTHHLFFNAESEYRRSAETWSLFSRNKTWDLGLKVNWNRDRLNEATAGVIRRWQLHRYPPSAEVTSSSYIMLLSGSVSIARDFFARGSIKGILLNNPLEDEKTFAKVEVGYDSRDWYRVSVGYERIGSDIDANPDLEYTGQGVFVRFTGKM